MAGDYPQIRDLVGSWEQVRQKLLAHIGDDASDRADQVSLELDALIQEAQSQQTELKMQNEELRRIQGELAESRDRYVALYDAAPVGYLTLNSAHRVTETNQTAAIMIEMQPDQIIGETIEDFCVETDRSACRACIHKADVTRQPTRREVRIRRRFANPLWVQMDVRSARSPVTHQRGFRVTLTDITQRKRAEKAGRRSRELLARIIDAIPVMIVIYEPELKSFRFNRELRRVLGWTEADAADGSFMARAYPDPELRRRAIDVMRSAEPGWHDFTVRAKDGSDVESSWANIHLPDETWVGIGIDMRERKRDRRRLEELNRTLEQRVAERTDELEATVSKLRAEAARRDLAEKVLRDRSQRLRELNIQLEQRARQLQSLTLQLSEAEEQQRRQIAVVLHDDLQQVLAGAKYQLRMLPERAHDNDGLDEACRAIGELLRRAIQQSRSLSHELSPPGLADGCLDAALRWLGHEMEEMHGLHVDIDATETDDPGQEAIRVFAFRAVQELLFNIVKHAETSHARVTVQRYQCTLELVVSDTGCGFDVTAMEDSDVAVFSGVGLPSIRERAAMLGGTLDIESIVGAGSTFRLRLPLGGPPEPEANPSEDNLQE
jgi:PAS domain S-box-containing protein